MYRITIHCKYIELHYNTLWHTTHSYDALPSLALHPRTIHHVAGPSYYINWHYITKHHEALYYDTILCKLSGYIPSQCLIIHNINCYCIMPYNNTAPCITWYCRITPRTKFHSPVRSYVKLQYITMHQLTFHYTACYHHVAQYLVFPYIS